MSILNVDKIQPIGGGSTITVDATDIQASTGTIRASTFSGDVSATGIGVTSLNVAGVTTFTGAVTSSSAITAHDYRSGGGVGNTLYLTSADDWRFRTTGGNERLRINSGGEILIGTETGTGNNLTVQDAGTSTTAGGNIVARFQSNGSGRDASIQLSDNVAHSALISMVSSNFAINLSGNERLRIESGGDVKVNAGDIYFATAGKGIVLGATSNTDAHTLDHYQEGTTGLTVKCGSVTVPLLNNTCKWTRIGNTLHLSAWIRVSGGQDASALPARRRF